MTAQLQRASRDVCIFVDIHSYGTNADWKGLLFKSLANQANIAYGEASPPFILVPPFASLLSGEASVLILHFSLATFFQHLEDTFSGAGVHGGPGENCTTQVVHTKKTKSWWYSFRHSRTQPRKMHILYQVLCLFFHLVTATYSPPLNNVNV